VIVNGATPPVQLNATAPEGIATDFAIFIVVVLFGIVIAGAAEVVILLLAALDGPLPMALVA
jgi:hypothetical protein